MASVQFLSSLCWNSDLKMIHKMREIVFFTRRMIFKGALVWGMTQGSSLSAIFLQRIKALDRRVMVKRPTLYSKCMYGYMPMHSLPYWQRKGGRRKLSLRNQEQIGKGTGNWLPGSSLFICTGNCFFSLFSLLEDCQERAWGRKVGQPWPWRKSRFSTSSVGRRNSTDE